MAEKDIHEAQRSWKGYDFDILNELADEGLKVIQNVQNQYIFLRMALKKLIRS